jgi:SAM-dependent methyltransferase
MPSNSNTRVNRYGALAAEVYDIDKPYFTLPDTRYHLDRLAEVDGPILEPACGSGRTLVPLLDAGHVAAGFDASPDMLERCRAKCAARGHAPDLSQQLFEDFRYAETFAAILVPVGTFTLIDDVQTALAVLRRFRSHLRPGGRLALDLPSLGTMANVSDDRRSWTAENGDLLTVHGQRVVTDWVAQRVQWRTRYERWRDNVLVETQLEPMSQRLWGLEEMRLALTATGFADITFVGDYDRTRAPRASDHTLTVEAVRA